MAENISNKPKVGIAVWTSLHSSHNIKDIILCLVKQSHKNSKVKTV